MNFLSSEVKSHLWDSLVGNEHPCSELKQENHILLSFLFFFFLRSPSCHKSGCSWFDQTIWSNQQQAFCASVRLILNSIYLLFSLPSTPSLPPRSARLQKGNIWRWTRSDGITTSIIASSGGTAEALNKRQSSSPPREAPIKRGTDKCCVPQIINTLSATFVPEKEKRACGKTSTETVCCLLHPLVGLLLLIFSYDWNCSLFHWFSSFRTMEF